MAVFGIPKLHEDDALRALARRGRHARWPGCVEQGARTGPRGRAPSPDRREHGRGRGRRPDDRPGARDGGRHQHRRAARAARLTRRDPARRRDLSARARLGRRRSCRAVGAEGEGGAGSGVEAPQRARRRLAAPEPRLTDGRSRAAALPTRSGVRGCGRGRVMPALHHLGLRRSGEVAIGGGVHLWGGGTGDHPARSLPPLRRGHHVLSGRRGDQAGGRAGGLRLARRRRGEGVLGPGRRRAPGARVPSRVATDGGDRIGGGRGDVLGDPPVLRGDGA